MKRLFSALVAAMLCVAAGAQTLRVQGIVRDKTDVVAGVAVQVKGQKTGALTDIDGHYAIDAPKGATLVFTAVGYETAQQKANTPTLDITLREDVQAVDEVVVTAIGIKQQKKKLGYTTQQVSTEALTQPGTVNIGNALSGQVAGLTVNNPTGMFQAPSFELRGKAPLLVVDGVPVESDLFDVSPENVESINVLKGTAAAALYGSRGKDGAILITTKLAQKEGLTIQASVSTMFSAGFTVYPKTQEEFGSGSNYEYAFWDGNDGGKADGDLEWGPRIEGQLIAQWNSPIRDKQTGETTPWWGDVLGSQYDDQTRYERVPIPYVAHDNLGEFMREGVITKATFAVTSKSRRSNISFNGDFAAQRGQVPGNSVYAGGLNFNSTFQLSNQLTLTAALSYNKVYSPNYPRYGYNPNNHMYTIMMWMGNDVDIRELRQHLYRPDSDGTRQANYNYAWYNNPYLMSYEAPQRHDRNVLNGQVKLAWDILPGLTVQGRAAARLVHTFEDLQVPKTFLNRSDSRAGDYKLWNTDKLNIDTDVLATYTRAFSRAFSLTANVGASLFYRQLRKGNQSTDGLIVPRVYNLGNSLGPVMASNSLTEKAIESVYGSLNIDLWEALFLTFTGRNDWSSTMAAGSRSYFYPSVAASTLVSQYVKLPAWMDYLKVNGAWAQVSSDLSPYSLCATYGKDVLYGSTPSVSYPGTLPNAAILPQKTTSLEVGLSASALKGRVSIDLAYYRLLDQNSIINLPISEASGFTTRSVNGNEYTTNGFEAVVSGTPIRRGHFTWTAQTNWSTSARKLTKIYGDQEKYGNLRLGDRADAIYDTQWEKTPDGQVILNEKSGLPQKSAFKTKIGNADPDVRFGLQNTFRYRNFTLNIDIDGAIGGTLISKTVKKMWWSGKHISTLDIRRQEWANGGQPGFVPEGVNVVGGSVKYDAEGRIVADDRQYKPNTTVVSYQTWCQNYPYNAAVTTSESAVYANTFSRSFVKLRRVALTCDLMPYIQSRLIKGLDVTLFGNNLAVAKKLPFLDPDFGASDNDLQDPSTRYIGVSATVKF